MKIKDVLYCANKVLSSTARVRLLVERRSEKRKNYTTMQLRKENVEYYYIEKRKELIKEKKKKKKKRIFFFLNNIYKITKVPSGFDLRALALQVAVVYPERGRSPAKSRRLSAFVHRLYVHRELGPALRHNRL